MRLASVLGIELQGKHARMWALRQMLNKSKSASITICLLHDIDNEAQPVVKNHIICIGHDNKLNGVLVFWCRYACPNGFFAMSESLMLFCGMKFWKTIANPLLVLLILCD